MSNPNFRVKLLSPLAKVMINAYESAGYDLYACDVIKYKNYEKKLPDHLLSGLVCQIPLGFATEFPSDWVGIIKDRSGLAMQGLHVVGGVIDSDYRGEWAVQLINVYHKMIEITPGMKIAQVIFHKIERPIIEVLGENQLLDNTIRGERGFGSSSVS